MPGMIGGDLATLFSAALVLLFYFYVTISTEKLITRKL
jgi:hypothetical protein